ncbi:hypothetical protein C8Q78DRAFT_127571 [Trametes maxima]|nr:hypothetical protein C8Q78DRAFT_127571 [Trametes maxima]
MMIRKILCFCSALRSSACFPSAIDGSSGNACARRPFGVMQLARPVRYLRTTSAHFCGRDAKTLRWAFSTSYRLLGKLWEPLQNLSSSTTEEHSRVRAPPGCSVEASSQLRATRFNAFHI